MEKILENAKIDMEGGTDRLKSELSKLRTGRANASLVENISAEYYGVMTPIKQLASISIPEPRTIAISPWDKNAIKVIEAAIRASDMGLNPGNDGQVVRINIPALTEERRKDLVKVLNQKAEEARIGVRNSREDAWKEISEKEKEGELSEDDKFRAKERLQKVVDEYNGKIEEMRTKKEEEIMTI